MKKIKVEKIKFTLRITKKQKEDITEKSTELGISENDVISLAVSKYLKDK